MQGYQTYRKVFREMIVYVLCIVLRNCTNAIKTCSDFMIYVI